MKVTSINKRWGTLQLTWAGTDELPVLRCEGRIVAGMETAALSAAVQSQIRGDLIIDLSGVSAMDAGGLGTLLALREWAENRGRRLFLMNPGMRVRRLMQRTGLAWLLDACHLPPESFPSFELQRCTA